MSELYQNTHQGGDTATSHDKPGWPSGRPMIEPAGPAGSLSCDAMVGARVESGFFRKFKNGDTVFHRPTGETWSLIADEKDGWVTPGGWPPSQGRAEDCKLVEHGRQAEDESVRQPSPNTVHEPRLQRE